MDKQLVDRRIKQMKQEGVLFKVSHDVGVKPTVKELQEQFNAIVLCGGLLLSCGGDEPRPAFEADAQATAEIADAARSVRSESVIILPNNPNIVMAAQQVHELLDSSVGVVPTASVPEAFAALLVFDSSADLDTNGHVAGGAAL